MEAALHGRRRPGRAAGKRTGEASTTAPEGGTTLATEVDATASGETRSGDEELSEEYRPRLSAIQIVSISSLLPADSPRSIGEDFQHVRLLSGLDTVLPPIIVHRPSMRIVDGMHRLRAAVLRGEETIRVRFFDGDERDAFVIAVRENTAHGLPLAMRDRTAAAERIVRSHPYWSDRVIARIAGLSARTVSDIRRAALPGDVQPAARVGQDGRVRPLDSSAGRIRAAELIAERPQASLRQIAKEAGISPGTVRDVRDRLSRGEDPLPISLRPADRRPGPESRNQPAAVGVRLRSVPSRPGPASPRGPEPGRSQMSLLNILIKDPSLRSGERGRSLLRLLSATASIRPEWDRLLDAVPEHCVGMVCRMAREGAAAWAEFADDLERRSVRYGARAEG
ncbi:ParB N-terminal domain-containing protein [Microbispora sp. NEAU-D428]|nr:ParB N-terminal domain-containing protein [Microbispora sitophila]